MRRNSEPFRALAVIPQPTFFLARNYLIPFLF
jgi:hypothetical protein